MSQARLRQFDDERLVRLCRAAGDMDAFETLLRRHQGALGAFLRSTCGRDEDVDDLVQAALVRAFTHIRQFRGASSFRTWLFTIGYREYLMQLRKRRSHQRLIDSMRMEPPPPRAPDPDWPIDLQAALSKLTEEERAAFILCDISGMTHGEAAKLLSVPLGTLKSQAKRAKSKLADYLGLKEGKTP